MPSKTVPETVALGHADACLLLADGTAFFGKGFGAEALALGELFQDTAMTGYQEVLTDPSYSGQIITFTFPHIGNTGCNAQDIEASRSVCAGLAVRELPTLPSNYRSDIALDAWLAARGIAGIAHIDTRALTRHIRIHGAQNAVIFRLRASGFWLRMEEMAEKLRAAPGMEGQELAQNVSTQKPYGWDESTWRFSPKPEARSPKPPSTSLPSITAKRNILRNLVEAGVRLTVVPAATSAEDILALKPDGIFLSNGPGDPAATGVYALPVIKRLLAADLPIFGICLGHQLLGLALGAKTEKMQQGHRGANHPVKDMRTGKVEITSQNHGFVVARDGLPDTLEITHVSLFDGTVQGIRVKGKPVFSVQGHPEASPGPHDSRYLFGEFVEMMEEASGFGLRASGKKK